MIYVTCSLTAKNQDQLRNHTLGNRVWAILPFLLVVHGTKSVRYRDGVDNAVVENSSISIMRMRWLSCIMVFVVVINLYSVRIQSETAI